jgi:hypothetical protein
VANQEELGKEDDEFSRRSIFVHISNLFSTSYNLTKWGQRLYFPSEGSRATDLFALNNPLPLTGFKPRTLSPIARELWWTDQEPSSVDIIPPSFSMLIYHMGDEQSARW